jgi:hypothetical protein
MTYFRSLWAGLHAGDQFKDTKAYCIFLGNPRSGSTLLGALLDAHPQMVISTELDVFPFIQSGYSKKQIFSLILARSKWFKGIGCKWEGYSYKVLNQWQGKYKTLKVIGDKKAAKSTLMLQDDPNLLLSLQTTINLPIYLLNVVRNPFDNITTISMKSRRGLPNAIDFYFSITDTVHKIHDSEFSQNLITVYLEDLISAPAQNLRKICKRLELECSSDYLKDCENAVFQSPKKTRQKIEWPLEIVESVE